MVNSVFTRFCPNGDTCSHNCKQHEVCRKKIQPLIDALEKEHKPWEIMKLYDQGRVTVKVKVRDSDNPWTDCHDPLWNWALCEYRIKEWL